MTLIYNYIYNLAKVLIAFFIHFLNKKFPAPDRIDCSVPGCQFYLFILEFIELCGYLVTQEEDGLKW